MTKAFLDENGRHIPVFFPRVTQKVAYTATHGVISNAVADGVRLVKLWCTTDAFVVSASSPVADTADMPITAKTDFYLPVNKGAKVSAVRITGDGTLYVTELL